MFVIQNSKGGYWTGMFHGYVKKDGFLDGAWILSSTGLVTNARTFESDTEAIELLKQFSTEGIAVCDWHIEEKKEMQLKWAQVPPESETDFELRKTLCTQITENVNFRHYEASEFNYEPAINKTEPFITFTEACKQADKYSTNPQYLSHLMKHVKAHQSQYAPHEYSFIKEHIEGYIEKLRP